MAIIGNRIRLPKVGTVKAVIHRHPEIGWVVKSATVSQESDGKYYISVLFEFDVPAINHDIDVSNAIRLDYASDGLYVDHNGNKGTKHKFFRESHDRLAKERRRLSRKTGSKKGSAKSNNYLKHSAGSTRYTGILQTSVQTISTKISTEIANQYDVVCVENLNMGLCPTKVLATAKATLDNGYGLFLNMLEYKLSDRGKYLVQGR